MIELIWDYDYRGSCENKEFRLETTIEGSNGRVYCATGCIREDDSPLAIDNIWRTLEKFSGKVDKLSCVFYKSDRAEYIPRLRVFAPDELTREAIASVPNYSGTADPRVLFIEGLCRYFLGDFNRISELVKAVGFYPRVPGSFRWSNR